MKKCKCKSGCKLRRFIGRLVGVAVVANVALFAVFFFDLDGKLLFNVVEPFLKNHYDNMERKDTLKAPYDIDKFPSYEY
ncbi:MAG: hypothetical protein VB039_05585 [Oscillospiraceae bacterium]|nr:hypothetical protein [Oscillospiraceae bacterium]